MNNAEHGKATASLVLGIIACALLFTGVGSVVSFILGIIGIVFANKAKDLGNTEGIRTAGFVLSLIGLIASVIVFFTTILAIGALTTLAYI